MVNFTNNEQTLLVALVWAMAEGDVVIPGFPITEELRLAVVEEIRQSKERSKLEREKEEKTKESIPPAEPQREDRRDTINAAICAFMVAGCMWTLAAALYFRLCGTTESGCHVLTAVTMFFAALITGTGVGCLIELSRTSEEEKAEKVAGVGVGVGLEEKLLV